MNKLFQILVPTQRNDGRPIHTRFHRVWDKKVREISGGLTIMPPGKGQWIDPGTGDVYNERMIPVLFIATDEQCDQIMQMTLEYYEQLAVLCWCVSQDVRMLERKSNAD